MPIEKPIGLVNKKTGKLWAGENYGEQSQESYDKLLAAGKLNPVQQGIDRFGNYLTTSAQADPIVGPVLNFLGAGVRTITNVLPEPIKQGAGFVLEKNQEAAENIAAATGLPVSLTDPMTIADVATGGAVAATRPAVKTAVRETLEGAATIGRNLPPPGPQLVPVGAGAAPRMQLNAEKVGQLNPTAGFASGLVLGAVVPGPSKGSIRLTRVGRQFPESAEQASDFLNNAAKYAEKHGSLKGYGRFQDPTGKLYKARPRGKNADGTQRFAMSPEEVQRAYTKKRNALDAQSSELEKFERANFEASVAKEKQDLIFQQSGLPSYIEHNRRLNSPFWKSARAKNQAAGDIDNLSKVYNLKFKTFKDNVDKILDNTKDSPIDAFYDPMIESIVVENIKTGERLGVLDQTKDIKTQLNRYTQKAL